MRTMFEPRGNTISGRSRLGLLVGGLFCAGCGTSTAETVPPLIDPVAQAFLRGVVVDSEGLIGWSDTIAANFRLEVHDTVSFRPIILGGV